MISGFTYVRNGLELDYCFELCIQSMLPFCDEVVVCDRDSTDGTAEILREMAARDPRLRIINMPWDEPHAKLDFLVEWMNYTRKHLQYENQLYLDADEILDPSSGPLLREIPQGEARTFHRLNFWRNGRTIIPHGHTCSHLVVRFGPSHLRSTSDEIYAPGHFPGPEPHIRRISSVDERLRIFHYGFLRKRQALFDKCRVVLKGFFGGYDERLVEAEKHPDRPWQEFCFHTAPYLEYQGEHPRMAVSWLKERNAL